MPDTPPKLRVVDDGDDHDDRDEIVRLKSESTSFRPVERIATDAKAEVPERLESPAREAFEGRSQEPGVEAILDQEEVVENIEQPWGAGDGKLVGVPYGWFVLILAALVSAGVWSVVQMRRGEQEVAQRLETVRIQNEDDEAEDRLARQLVERIEEVVAGYLAASTVEEMLPLVRHPQRVKPMIEAEWQVRPKRPLTFARMTDFLPATIPGGTFWIVRAEVRDGERQNLIVEQTGETDARVDWETHVCRQPMDWERYVAERPAESAMDFRVRAVPDIHHSHEFANSGHWRCYRLTAKNSDDHLFGYAQAEGDLVRTLDEMCRHSPGGIATAILRLRYPAGGNAPRGVVIEKIIAPRWLIVADPSEDGP